MQAEHQVLLDQAPSALSVHDTWARLCCEQGLLALEQKCYGVGAVLVNSADELLCSSKNQVFSEGFHSHAHAEMLLLDQFELNAQGYNRDDLTLFVSLEPCLMCYGRILLSGITRVRYLAKDKAGGFADYLHLLPPVWRDLAVRVSVEQANVQPYWIKLAESLMSELQDPVVMRQRTLAAWKGM
ncbi:nucleoside deaminase [Bacterioplanoides sp.]|uniref:nucleoside deaminase n=1 Tax=Bacterioplanoides sp. TaxID=2066072 RepID=UPI003B5AF74A